MGCDIVSGRNGQVITRHDIDVLPSIRTFPLGALMVIPVKALIFTLPKGLSMEMARLSDDMDMEYSPCSSVNSMPPIAFLKESGKISTLWSRKLSSVLIKPVGQKLLMVLINGDNEFKASELADGSEKMIE